MTTNLIFFGALAFGALIAGRGAHGTGRVQLLVIGSNLVTFTVGLIVGTWLSL